MTLAAWSYSIAAAAFVVSSPLMPRRWRAVWFAGAVWAFVLAAVALADRNLWGQTLWLPVLELARYTAMLLMFRSLTSGQRGLTQLNRAGWILAALLCVAGPYVMNGDHVLSRVGLMLSFLGLVNIEQVLRSALPRGITALKLWIVGMGGIFAYDLFLFSQSELLGQIDSESWALRGIVVAAFIPFAVAGGRRFENERSSLFVSRHVVFYTTAFMSVGVYLSLMALGGYYVRVHGGTWGELLRLLFFVGAGIVFAMVALSNSAWRRLRVFLTKHFYRNKYDYRVEWLRFISTLSSSEMTDGDTRKAAIRAVAQIFESPGGLLYLISEDGARLEPVAGWVDGVSIEHLPESVGVDHDLPRFMAERQWVIDLHEYARAPDVYRNIEIPSWMTLEQDGWRMVSPLLELDRLIGFLALRQPRGGFQMTFEDRDLLRTVGSHVATLVAQQNAERKLTESRQFDAFNRFAAFVMHDLKNSVAQLQLLVSNAARHRHNPEFMDDAIETIGNTAARMNRLIEQLQSRDTSGAMRPVSLPLILRAVADRATARTPAVTLECEVIAWVKADSERLGAVVDHAVRNAQEAAGKGGIVTLSLGIRDQFAEIGVADDGIGMDATFVRERLFRPFDSTKGAKGMGVGAYQIREYVKQLGGAVEVQSSPGRGTDFLIRLPLCQTPANRAS